MAMNSTLGRGRSADWAAEVPATLPAFRARRSGGFGRVLIGFCIGISATLLWQSKGDAAREIISKRYPQLAWLAPQAPAALPAPAAVVPPIGAADPQELKTMSLGLAAVRQRVDKLTAGQDQISQDLAMKLQAAKQEILDKISVLSPPPAPARKPGPAR